MSNKSEPHIAAVGSGQPLLQYAVEDELISKENPGIRDEINADLKKLDDIDIDQFLEEEDELNDDDESEEEKEEEDNDDNDDTAEEDSVDEDNFFLEDEEAGRKNKKARPNAGQILFECFEEFDIQVKIKKEIETGKRVAAKSSHVPNERGDSLNDSTDGQNDEIESFSEEEDEDDGRGSRDIIRENNMKTFLYPCPHASSKGCEYRTNRKNNLSRHLNTMHLKLEVPEDCCGKIFWTRAELNVHNRAHHGESDFPCPDPKCDGLRFSRRGILRRHIKAVHLRLRPWRCEFCSYRSSHKSNYDRHFRKLHSTTESQEKVKTYICAPCNYAYTVKAKFEAHLINVHP